MTTPETTKSYPENYLEAAKMLGMDETIIQQALDSMQKERGSKRENHGERTPRHEALSRLAPAIQPLVALAMLLSQQQHVSLVGIEKTPLGSFYAERERELLRLVPAEIRMKIHSEVHQALE